LRAVYFTNDQSQEWAKQIICKSGEDGNISLDELDECFIASVPLDLPENSQEENDYQWEESY